ncbi:hypothetical protein ACWEQL_20695 [Kitasatospora sp. NPDC004240]
MTTASPREHGRDHRNPHDHRGRRPRRHRPRRGPAAPAAATPTPAPAAPAPVPAGCCPTSTTRHRTLGGTVVQTRWHQPTCPVWTAR